MGTVPGNLARPVGRIAEIRLILMLFQNGRKRPHLNPLTEAERLRVPFTATGGIGYAQPSHGDPMSACLLASRSQVFSDLIPMLNTVAEPCKPGWYQSGAVQKKTRATVSWFGAVAGISR